MTFRLALLVLLLVIPLFADEGKRPAGFRFLSTNEGLPSEYPFRMARASGGLWVTLRAASGPFRMDGLVCVSSNSIRHYHGTNSGLRSDGVNAVAALPDGELVAATDGGLHRFHEGRFIPEGAPVPLSHMAVGPDGTVWAAGSTDTNSSAIILPPGKAPRHFFIPRRTRLLRLIPVTSHLAYVVHQDGILRVDEKGFSELPLEKTPLWRPASTGPERRIPSILIYDAALFDGNLCVSGHTGNLSILRGTNWIRAATGRFDEMATTTRALFLSDLEGNIHRWDGKELAFIHRSAAAIHTLYPSRKGSLWAIVEPKRGEPYELVRFDSTKSGAAFRLPLGRNGLLSPGVCDMMEEENGDLWLATNDGLWAVPASLNH